jgi:hypothetical protein
MVITAVAVVGTWRSFVRSGATRTVIVVAGVNLLCLLLAISWVFLRVRVGAQGRYLFPAIVPALTLMWLGTAAWVPARLRPAVSTALIAAFAILDLVAWTVVAIPAYL